MSWTAFLIVEKNTFLFDETKVFHILGDLYRDRIPEVDRTILLIQSHYLNDPKAALF